MQHIPTPEEENDFLQSLRARTSRVEPPESLSPEHIRENLPQRRAISMTRRIAPYAAMAACLAVILTGTAIFRKGGLSGSPELYTGNAATSQAAVAEAPDSVPKEADPYMGFAATALPEDYSALYAAVEKSRSLEMGSADRTGSMENAKRSAGALKKDETSYSLTQNGQLFLSTEGGAENELTPEFPPEGTWTATELLLSGDRLVILGEGVFASGEPGSAAVVYDLSQPEMPSCLTSFAQSGGDLRAELANGLLILESTWTPADPSDGSQPERYVPSTWEDGWTQLFTSAEIPVVESGSGYAVLTCTDLETGVTLSRLAGYGLTPGPLSETGVAWGEYAVTWEDGNFHLNERK